VDNGDTEHVGLMPYSETGVRGPVVTNDDGALDWAVQTLPQRRDARRDDYRPSVTAFCPPVLRSCMTRVCLVGDDGVNLRYELLSRETSRNALMTYDLREPFENTLSIETVSLGAAVSLLNDLDWYLVRFVEEALVLEPSVSEDEWLSRGLAAAIRADRIDAADTGRYLKVYGVERADPDPTDASDGATAPAESDTTDAGAPDADEAAPTRDRPPRLAEPMLVARTGETIPEYDLRAVNETLTVRLTEGEFDA
jgi:hypothetical protein